ncbi:MAG: tetratricopeptide repeat protein [Campylobacterota bacterium]|nr:tetratricopeptide repeat protein [Campylobacterota bacterium]
MNNLFIETRDPLFGVIVFFALIFVVTFFSYWWGRYRAKDDHRYLDNFIKDLNTVPSENEIKELIHTGNISSSSWFLLASSYIQQGNYEKSIEIYKSIIEAEKEPSKRKKTLILLGQTYLKAGFLERSKEVFLKILKHEPRTPEALYSLLLVYDRLKEYKKALDVLEPLHELDENIEHETLYLECAYLLQRNDIQNNKKIESLLTLYKKHQKFTYLIFEYLFKIDSQMAWEHLRSSDYKRLSDLLWYLDDEKISMEAISSHSYLRELFSARGVVDLANDSEHFELDVLIKLNHAKEKGATLQFEYLCKNCKHIFPFAFHRCPNCHNTDTLIPEMLLSKDSFEENYNF